MCYILDLRACVRACFHVFCCDNILRAFDETEMSKYQCCDPSKLQINLKIAQCIKFPSDNENLHLSLVTSCYELTTAEEFEPPEERNMLKRNSKTNEHASLHIAILLLIVFYFNESNI